MGVSSTTNRVTLAGNGSSLVFGFPYYFFLPADLFVYKYDTLLGGVTGPYLLNTDYTIVGPQNYQLLYQSGANIVFSNTVAGYNSAPLTTDIVVIIREPIEQQNYALAQGGTISSTAIVQQFDYLTLLVQRLEDQVSRCIQVPDGLGEPFAPQLPSTVVLSPGSAPIVNPAGNGWVLSGSPGGGPGWSNIVVPFGTAQAAGLTNHIPLFVLPAGAILEALVIKHTIAFSGAGISDVYTQIGIAGNYGEWIPDFDVAQAVADQTFDNVEMGYIGSFANPTQVYLTAVSVGANLSALTAGSVTVWYKFEMVT